MDLTKIPSLDKLPNVKDKRVLVRADFNVPQDDAGNITSDLRITAALPTIKHLLGKGARVVLMSHLGRPKGAGFEAAYSLAPVAKRLGELLGQNVALAKDCTGEHVHDEVKRLKSGEVLLLENVRFHAAEQKGDEVFGKELASLGDIYVNDAFGTCHRGDASMVWPAKLLPGAAGYLVKAECDAIGKVLLNPAKPCIAIVGGAKVKDKIPLLNNILGRVNEVCIGGGMAYTFLKVQGKKIGVSLYDAGSAKIAEQTLIKARELGVVVHLPTDHVCAQNMDSEAVHQIKGDIPDSEAAFDIGDQTAKAFSAAILRGKTILFNGPVGVFEKERFSNGTRIVINAIAEATQKGAYSVVGGGDSAAAVEEFKMEKKMSHVSTGGGASLTLLEGGKMPALDALVKS
ncbi:MAG: phosphoglycerate kinase [Planctomycetes bacterium]|nr:phosphoglycerate kinase [Planctomycetota bacterium]